MLFLNSKLGNKKENMNTQVNNMNVLIENSQIVKWMKKSGKTLDDLDKYEKYEYEQTIKILKNMMKQRDMMANATARTSGDMKVRHSFKEQNEYHLMPDLLDKIIDLGLDIGVYNSNGLANCFSDSDEDLKPGFKNGSFDSSRRKVSAASNGAFKYLPQQPACFGGDLTIYVELAERIRDVNTELICLKEDFKLEIERNKTLQDKNVVDINNLLSRIEKQEEKNNKQTEMINVLTTSIKTKEENLEKMIKHIRIVIGLMMIVYITFEFYTLHLNFIRMAGH